MGKNIYSIGDRRLLVEFESAAVLLLTVPVLILRARCACVRSGDHTSIFRCSDMVITVCTGLRALMSRKLINRQRLKLSVMGTSLHA